MVMVLLLLCKNKVVFHCLKKEKEATTALKKGRDPLTEELGFAEKNVLSAKEKGFPAALAVLKSECLKVDKARCNTTRIMRRTIKILLVIIVCDEQA
nr:hypothetical protein [Tanacetum cinerariifolium]